MNTNTTAPSWTLGDRIRKAREGHNWRQADLAAQLHKSRTAIAGWENGTHSPSYADLYMIASVTDVDIEWLAGISPSRDEIHSQYPWPNQLELFHQHQFAQAA